ncbi:transposable element Tcb1 transposase [Trichonephila clavipes]|nr:transposable element Tcb1 transposase [Trichonephila clavipes]
MLPLTPTHRRLCLEWYHARRNWTAAEWKEVVFSDESRFDLSSDDNRVCMGRPRGERQSCLCFTATHHSHSWCDDGKGVTRLPLYCYYPSLACLIPRFVSNRAYLGSFEASSCIFHELERTRGKVTANMERNVLRHRTELVCLIARSYRIVQSR